MKTFQDPTATTLLDRANALTRARVPYVLATVVRAQRPSSARAGDIALLHADGWIDGFIGGAGVDASVREHGQRVISSDEPLLLRIVPADVLVPTEEGTVTVVSSLLTGGAIDIFLEARIPAPRVLVSGDVPLVRAMTSFGTMLGFAVEQMDDAFLAQPSGHDAAFIVASTGRMDSTILSSALRSGVPYVGLVASPQRAEQVLAELDLEPGELARLHVPAGLTIGASSAPETALAVFAEVVAEMKGVATAARRTPDAQPAADEQSEVALTAVPEPETAPADDEHEDRHGLDDGSLYGRDRSSRPALNAVREREDQGARAVRDVAPAMSTMARDYQSVSTGRGRSEEPMTLSFDRGSDRADRAADRGPEGSTRMRPRPAIARVAVDPVCGMSVATGPTSPHVEHDGTTSWFCGEDCRLAFTG
ncbi:XdhC family protein [Goekera deserti]|uniref:XdhC family protein n=1 Tax=Goekera deserti TaxID=2497753 RepID=UPI001877BFFB|nr:XdhC family protein [Goekera deserti]